MDTSTFQGSIVSEIKIIWEGLRTPVTTVVFPHGGSYSFRPIAFFSDELFVRIDDEDTYLESHRQEMEQMIRESYTAWRDA